MKRILVTGGAGFIGSHLCDALLAQGHEVLCLDNFFTGRKENVAAHFANPRFELIRHDIVEPLLVEVDQIYNLACPASPIHYQENPVKTIKANVLGALHVLGIAKRVGARVLQASTSEVYGDPQVHPQKEDYWGHVNPIGPRACYDEGKRVAETLFFDYHRQGGVDIRVARIFNTYGPRMQKNDGRVVSNFIVQAIKKEALTIYGEGKQTRSFCYVDDMVEGLIRLMNCENTEGPVNLGNPEEHTVLELAEMIHRLSKNQSGVVHKPVPQDDPKRRKPDITRARELLGWEPKVALEVGLHKTLDDFRMREQQGQL